MKTKIFNAVCKTRYLALLVVLIFTCGNVWGDYTITFKTSGTTDLINAGGDYATSAETAYVTGTASGVQFGSGSKGGNIVLTMTASGQVKASKITLNGYCKFASNGGDCKVTITFTDNTTENHTPSATTTATPTDVTITNSTKTLKSIKLESTAKNKRFYVTGVTVVAAAATTYNVYLMSGCTGGSYSSNKGTSGSGTGVYSSCTKYSGISAGTSVTITATPTSGYQFDGWTDGGYSIIFDDSSNEITPSSTTSTTATFTMPSSDVVIWQCNFSESCANSVTINKGTQTNCTFTLSKSGAQASCSGVSTTVSVTPNTGYGNPSVTQSGASAAPTITGSGNSWTVSYGNNTTGTSMINVSCSANNYTITLDKDLTPTTAGTASIAVTYNSNTNLTSAITKPTKTGWTFAGYFTAKNGGGTQIIDASGNVIASAGGGSTYTDASKNWKYAGNITLYAKWTCTVTWSVNGATNVYPAQTVTYNSSGSKVTSVPTPDPASYCGQVFAGWTTAEYSGNSAPSPLYKTASEFPNATGDQTFYAVFADYEN